MRTAEVRADVARFPPTASLATTSAGFAGALATARGERAGAAAAAATGTRFWRTGFETAGATAPVFPVRFAALLEGGAVSDVFAAEVEPCVERAGAVPRVAGEVTPGRPRLGVGAAGAGCGRATLTAAFATAGGVAPAGGLGARDATAVTDVVFERGRDAGRVDGTSGRAKGRTAKRTEYYPKVPLRSTLDPRPMRMR